MEEYTGSLFSDIPGEYEGKSPELVLKEVFGYSEFRSLQKDIIENVLSGKDTVAIMPTGGGKSLCYQIPALIMKGITIVVSPLIALMQDQVSALNAAGVNAVFLNSSLDAAQYRESTESIILGNVKIIYVSPEGLATGRIRNLFQQNRINISCITVDEAHCISSWGHDFRPDYLEISSFRKQFPKAVCLALTATATQQVRDDIASILEMKSPAVLIASFNRKNIFLNVQPKKNPIAQTLTFIREHGGESGIVYCFSRKQVEELYAELKDAGISVTKYHAGLSDEERTENQKLFIRDETDVMVATVAFGMGINKPNVRYVIHFDLPKSLEQYYQEIGRAGRDGNASTALLLYSFSDVRKIRYFFDSSSDAENSERLLKGMLDYSSARKCRRKILLSYFGEDWQQQEDEKDFCCDVCSNAGGSEEQDVTIPVQKFLSCVYRTKERYGASYLIDILCGARTKRIMENRHNMISTWAIGKELSKEAWFELADAMEDAGIIRRTGEYNIINVTSFGKELLEARDKILLPVRISFEEKKATLKTQPAKSAILHKKNAGSDDPAVMALAADLRLWRKNVADEENVPPYVIFGDKTLMEIAEKKPQSRQELLSIYGIGEIKAEKIGPRLLSFLRSKI